jgi:hypothetical protein
MPKNESKVFVRMPKGVYESLSEMAERDRRSLNAQILVLLEKAIKKNEERTGEECTAT